MPPRQIPAAAATTGSLQSGFYLEAGYDVFTLLPALRQALELISVD